MSRDGDHKVSVLTVDGSKVEHAKLDIHAGHRPYPLDISSRGDVAAVANIGVGAATPMNAQVPLAAASS